MGAGTTAATMTGLLLCTALIAVPAWIAGHAIHHHHQEPPMTTRTPRRAPLGIITATLLLIAAGAALAAAVALGGWWWLLMAPALALALLGGAGLAMDLPKVPRDDAGNQLGE